MHFSIPDIEKVKDHSENYSSFILYLNGVPFTSLRYSKLRDIYLKIKEKYSMIKLPSFPPRNIMMSDYELEERREMLERFIQLVAQNSVIIQGLLMENYLFQAHLKFFNSIYQGSEPLDLKIYLSLMFPLQNYVTISNQSLHTLNTNIVLKVISTKLNIPEHYMQYFGLYIVYLQNQSIANDAISHNQLQSNMRIIFFNQLTNLESPTIALECAKISCYIKSLSKKQISHPLEGPYLLLRTSYWDTRIDKILLSHESTAKILVHQMFDDGFISESEMEKIYMYASNEASLSSLLTHLKTINENAKIAFPSNSIISHIKLNNQKKLQSNDHIYNDNSLPLKLYGFLPLYQTTNNSVAIHKQNNPEQLNQVHPISKQSQTVASAMAGQEYFTVSTASGRSFSHIHQSGMMTCLTRNCNRFNVSNFLVGLNGFYVEGFYHTISSPTNLSIGKNQTLFNSSQNFNGISHLETDEFNQNYAISMFFKTSRIKSWRVTSVPLNLKEYECFANLSEPSYRNELPRSTSKSNLYLNGSAITNSDPSSHTNGEIKIKKHYCTNRMRYNFSFQYLTANDIDFEWIMLQGMEFPLFLSSCLHNLVRNLVEYEQTSANLLKHQELYELDGNTVAGNHFNQVNSKQLNGSNGYFSNPSPINSKIDPSKAPTKQNGHRKNSFEQKGIHTKPLVKPLVPYLEYVQLNKT